MRYLICAGGTGGGIYPALAAAQALRSAEPDCGLLWVGGRGGMEERIVPHAGLPFAAIRAAGMHGVGWRQAPVNLIRLMAGMAEAVRILAKFRPRAVLLTGGYVTVPVAIAARLRGVPTVVYVPDIEPALAAAFASRSARRIAVTTEESKRFYPQGAPVIVTGYPLRREVLEASRETGRRTLDLPADQPVLLVFGGSRGARSINRALWAALPKLLEEMDVVHITGTLDFAETEQVNRDLPGGKRLRYKAFPFLDEAMGGAMAAADLAISRAGASVLGEFPHFGLPSILVPYPHAWKYQQTNAEYLAKFGAADILKDSELSTKLEGAVSCLMKNETRRMDMRRALAKVAIKNGALKLAGELIAAAEEGRA